MLKPGEGRKECFRLKGAATKALGSSETEEWCGWTDSGQRGSLSTVFEMQVAGHWVFQGVRMTWCVLLEHRTG